MLTSHKIWTQIAKGDGNDIRSLCNSQKYHNLFFTGVITDFCLFLISSSSEVWKHHGEAPQEKISQLDNRLI